MIRNNRLIIGYGISLALLLALLRWMELKYLLYKHVFMVYVLFIAVLFLIMGIWISKKLTRPRVKTEIQEHIIYRESTAAFIRNQSMIDELGISLRELEVLELMSIGYSNQAMASQLYVSPNTIKTHLSRIFEKLEVGRRAQAIEKAKRLGIIP
jgi:two-component system, NarL family, response regulator LiaR